MVQGFRKQGPQSFGVFESTFRGIRMLLALLLDGRIPFRYKLLPVGAFLWAIFPDLIPGILDDIGLFYWAPRYFMNELCRVNRPDVFAEHFDRIFPEEAADQKRELEEKKQWRLAGDKNGER